MKKKVFVTGISGMVGSHLADYILEHHPDYEVHGLIRWRSPRDNIRHIEDRLYLHQGDLRDLKSLVSIFQEYAFNYVFHLAAQSYVMSSFNSPNDTFQTNVLGTINLLDTILLTDRHPRMLMCSSSEVYGQVTQDEVPIQETQPFRPASPYAVSKCTQDLIAYQYGLNYGMDILKKLVKKL